MGYVIASSHLMTLWHSTNGESVKNSQVLHVTLGTSVASGAIGVGWGTTEIRFDWKASHERAMNLMEDKKPFKTERLRMVESWIVIYPNKAVLTW